ncbi:MAG: stage III sporulation protein AF [Eubacterium sp.]|jgi:hypothetical protein|nr:stage III sporulation protein AF [Eubacterium sp.]NBI86362.1 hypothetical protein [Lachnospiraceae bacterium]
MDAVLGWVKNYSMVVLLLTVLSQTAAKKEYRKYIQLFIEIVWVITLINPLFAAFGKSGDLFENISYDSFWQGLEGIRMDREKLDFLDEGYYLEYYEKAIEEDVKLLARNNGYEVEQTVVCLDGEYGVEEMEITLLEGDGEGILALRDKIAGYYQIGADKIVIKAD